MTDNEIIKAFDILDKFEFFGGQREGRKLWFNKPTDIQNKDIGEFLRDLDFLKQFINRQNAELDDLKRDTIPKLQEGLKRANKYGVEADKENEQLKAEIERLKDYNENLQTGNTALSNEILEIEAEARKEFAEKLHEAIDSFREKREMVMLPYTEAALLYVEKNIDNLLKEMEKEI